MAALLLMPDRDTTALAAELAHQAPALDVRVWPEVGCVADIRLAVVWRHPPGCLRGFPNLKAALSYGAGVDGLLGDTALPKDLTLARFVDPGMARAMAAYALAAAVAHRRRFDAYRDSQAAARWRPLPRRGGRAGVMGLGQMGGETAKLLAQAGFETRGWSRTPRRVAGVRCFHGDGQKAAFLTGLDCLICALPLTPATRDILNRDLFRLLNRDAVAVNIARGEHLVEADLLDALDAGRLGGAWLDVFREEPLPPDHPFWGHPRVRVTPHAAGPTDPRVAAAAIAEEYARLDDGRPPRHAVDRERGY